MSLRGTAVELPCFVTPLTRVRSFTPYKKLKRFVRWGPLKFLLRDLPTRIPLFSVSDRTLFRPPTHTTFPHAPALQRFLQVSMGHFHPHMTS